MALHDWDPERGLKIWKGWSLRSTKHVEETCDAKWPSFTRGGGCTMGTVFHEALAHGWAWPMGALADEAALALRAEAKAFTLLSELLAARGFLSRLAQLETRNGAAGAQVVAILGETLGQKFKVREFDRAMKADRAKARVREQDHEARAGQDGNPYEEQNGQTFLVMETKEGTARMLLADFTARIVREVERHEAGGQTLAFEIVARHGSGIVAEVTVAAERYAMMTWVETMGAAFQIPEGKSTRGHLRAAIQRFSDLDGPVPREVVYTSLGWITLDEVSYYLHAGGAIGPDGTTAAVRVEVDHALASYTLPDPPAEGDVAARAVAACFEILDLAQDGRPGAGHVAAILATLTWRAILGPGNFSVHFDGGTGTRKTSVARLAHQHWGGPGGPDAALPASWSSTPASLQRSAYDGKDALLVIDELTGAKALDTATEFFQAQGNLKGRDRMGPSMQPLPSLDPRCCVLSTGEAGVVRTSAQGRTLTVNFTTRTIDLRVLTRLQERAARGAFATAMAGFVHWLAFEGRIDAARREHAAEVARIVEPLRARTEHQGVHPRHLVIVAELLAAHGLFLRYATAVGACDQRTADGQAQAVRGHLLGLLGVQAEIQRELEPASRALELLKVGFTTKLFHLQDARTDFAPAPYQTACGWHKEWIYQGGECGQILDWKIPPNSKGAGFIDAEAGFIYMPPATLEEVVHTMARRQGTPFENVSRTIRDLADAKLLVPYEEKTAAGTKTRSSHMKRIRGTIGRYVQLRIADLFGEPEHEEETPEPAGNGYQRDETPRTSNV